MTMNVQDLHIEYTVNETISNPTDRAEVVGFIGRNTTLGNDALLMKGSLIRDTGRLPVPEWVVAHAIEDAAEMALLSEDSAFIAMEGQKRVFSVIRNRGQVGPDKLNVIDTDSDNFTEVDREDLTIRINS